MYISIYGLLPAGNVQLLKKIIEPGNANLEETDNRMFKNVKFFTKFNLYDKILSFTR